MLKRYEESGLSERAFRQKMGLSRHRLRRWRERLAQADAAGARLALATRDQGREAGPVEFVEVHLPRATEPFAVQTRSGRTVLVPEGFNAAALRTLLAVVEESGAC